VFEYFKRIHVLTSSDTWGRTVPNWKCTHQEITDT